MLGLVATAVIGAAVTLLLQGIISAVLAVYQSRNGEFAGQWYSVIPPAAGDVERRDAIRVRQRGLKLSIVAKRYMPPAEKGRVWKMAGYCHGNVLVAVFFTTTPRRDPTSYGVITLHRDSATRGANVWRGNYLRPGLADLESMVRGRLPEHPIIWQQERP